MTAIKLYFLLLLCATHSFSHSLSSFTKSHIFSNLPILNAYATKKGHVPIYKDNNGFYVQVDLSDDSYEASDSTLGPWTVEMMLGLYTSHTLLAQNCLDFQSYNCSSDTSCVVGNSQPANYDFPSFSTAAYVAWLNMFLDYNNWDFKDLSLIATSCDSNATLPYGISRSGIVGLGTADGAATNFDSFELFSIHIDEDMSGGILLFGTDLDSYAASSSATATLLTDENWTTSALGKIQIGDTELVLNATILLDINEDTVGFPLALYKQIISSLNTVMEFECSSDTAYPTCPYTGSVSGLPDIILNINDDQSIPIPGSAYAKGATDDGTGVILNMRGYSSSLNGTSFVTKTYENCIILGYNFLANYYTVFNGTSETSVTITLYPTATPSSSPSWLITLIEVLGALAFVLICICLYCVCRKKFKRKTRPRNQVGPESATAPLMVGYNPTSMVYTNYDSTHEHGQSIMNGTFSHQLDGDHEVRGRFRTGLRSSQNLGQRHMERPVDSIAEDED